MRKFKITICLLVVFAIMSLTACGNNNNQTENDQTGGNESSYFVTNNVGDIITFGKYEQDNILTNGKENIEWIVLAKEDNKILVTSRYLLEYLPFDSALGNGNATWENCTIRKWLNETFFNDSFTASEQLKIQDTNLKAERYSRSHISFNPGNDTIDKIFILSSTEATEYFDSDSERECLLTEYARCSRAASNESYVSCWWLRTLYNSGGPMLVHSSGTVLENYYFKASRDGIRPALWISL